jgi:hypothetical protein
MTPRSGPCNPWITTTDVRSVPKCNDIAEEFCVSAAQSASEILYLLSGVQFTGADCGPVTIRPVARPTDVDLKTWGSNLSPLGYFSSWGSCSAFGFGNSGTVSHYGCVNPPEIELGAYPVTAIESVYIDGVLIPADEYQIENYRTLTRLRTSASANPTERWGWPTCQQLDLPLTEVNTFGVTYLYGQDPPETGKNAAKALAAELAKQMAGMPNDLPTRVTSVTRQGITTATTDVMDLLKAGQLGVYLADVFVHTYNPHGQRRKALVFSPDRGRPRRQPN